MILFVSRCTFHSYVLSQDLLYNDNCSQLNISFVSFQQVPEHGVTTVFVELGDTKIEVNIRYLKKSKISSFPRMVGSDVNVTWPVNPMQYEK